MLEKLTREKNTQLPLVYLVKDLVCNFLKIMFSCGYCLDIYLHLLSLGKKAKQWRRVVSLLICKTDTPVHHYTQTLKYAKLEVPNTLV